MFGGRLLPYLCPLCRRASARLGWGDGGLWSRGAHVQGGPVTAERVLVVHKTSRLDFEKLKRPDLSEKEIADRVSPSSNVVFMYRRTHMCFCIEYWAAVGEALPCLANCPRITARVNIIIYTSYASNGCLLSLQLCSLWYWYFLQSTT